MDGLLTVAPERLSGLVKQTLVYGEPPGGLSLRRT